MSEKEDKLFIECACSSEAVELEYEKQDNTFYFSIWFRGFRNEKMLWTQRLRFIFRILTKGNIWSDFIILDKKSATKIAKFINSKP